MSAQAPQKSKKQAPQKSKKRARSSSDPEYIPPTPSTDRGRPSYASSFDEVAKNQGLQRTESKNHFVFDSAIDDSKNILNSNMQEEIPIKDKNGKARPANLQKPALDHFPVQFAALQEMHDERVMAERADARDGLARRASVDFAEAFAGATKDPKNLRLVTHAEHKKDGGSKQKGYFTDKERADAAALLDQHMPALGGAAQSQHDFNLARPKWHTPLPGGVAPAPPEFTRQTRARTQSSASGSPFSDSKNE